MLQVVKTSLPLENEAGFHVLLQNATLGILLINGNEQIESSNPCKTKLFDYTPAELIGNATESLLRFVSKRLHDPKKCFSRPNARTMGTGLELFARKKDGDAFL